jgi:ABC-type lipoprotein export system ATPase subunit
MITGIDRPTSGEVQIGETLVHHLNESDMSRWRGLNLGIVFQFYQLMPVLSLLENTMLPMDIAGKIPPAEREARALRLLKMVGLDEIAHKMPAAVSGGQQQAAAIARAMANDPPYIVADEPTGNLDTRTAESIFGIFEELVGQGKTIIMVTHDPQLAQRTTRTLLLCDGEVIHPAVAEALPWLNHNQMLRVTKHSRVRHFAPGQAVITPGQMVTELYVLAEGGIDIHSGLPGQALHLPAGQVFGQYALLGERPAQSAVSAGPEGAEALAIPQELVQELLLASPSLRAALLRPRETRP